MIDLRPCPSCSGNLCVYDVFDGDVRCLSCKLRGPIAGSSEASAKLWNAFPRRDTEAQITHSDECWRWHLDCAVAKVEELQGWAEDNEDLVNLGIE